MPTCGECLTNHAEKKWTEKIRFFFFRIFREEITDLTNEKFTKGFGEGYREGFENAKKLGAFSSQALQAIDGLRQELRTGLGLPTSFDEKSLIEFQSDGKGGAKILIGGEAIDKQRLTDLKIEAEKMRGMDLWRLMTDKLKALAVKKAVNESVKWEDVLAGKMSLHNVALMESMLEALRKTE